MQQTVLESVTRGGLNGVVGGARWSREAPGGSSSFGGMALGVLLRRGGGQLLKVGGAAALQSMRDGTT